MSKFIMILEADLKRFFCSKKLIVFILFLILLGYVVDRDCDDYISTRAKSKEFQKTEAEIFKSVRNYTHYQAIGFRVLCIQHPLSVIFLNSGFFSECTSQITIPINLIIYEDLKGKSVLKRKYLIPNDFSGILMILGALYSVLFLGFPTLRNTEYFKMISTSLQVWLQHFFMIFSRFIILVVQLVLLFCGAYLVTRFHHIQFPKGSLTGLVGYFWAALILLGCLLIIGALIGQMIKNKAIALMMIIVLWAVTVFFAEAAVEASIKKDIELITSQYKIELKKLDISYKFEKRIEDKYGKFNRDNIEVERKIIEDFWNNEYKQITAFEKKQRKEIAEVIEKYNQICLTSPITLYILTADELSTRGYGTFLDFYAYVIDLQVKFVRFFIDRTYYNDPKILVSFVKGDENLFQGKSKLPPGFRKGVMLNLGYIIILYLISFFLFKKSLHKISKEEIDRLGDVNLKMENENLYVWLKKKNYFSKALFNLFSGNFKKMKKKGFRGKVVINGNDIAGEKNKEEFQYLSHPDFLPGDIKVRHFISFYAGMSNISASEVRDSIKSSGLKNLFGKPFSKLTNKERFAVMMPFLKIGKKRIYLIDDIATGLPIECGIELNELMKDLASNGCLVIYLTSTIRADGEAVNMKEYFHEGMLGWETLIGQNKITLEYEKKLQGEK